MASKPVPDSITTHTNNIVDHLVVNIKELIQDASSHAHVCVYRVPKSMSSGNPEAFTPQFVGLGPYHHCRPEVYTKQKLKVAAVKSVLNHSSTEFKADTDAPSKLIEALVRKKVAPVIRDSYDRSIGFNDDTLLYLMAVDALFLFDLLRSLVIIIFEKDGTVTKFELQVSILTGKQEGMPLVNAAGVEFTKDAIISDIFMLENQIPTCILRQIITVLATSIETEEIHLNVDDKYVGSRMLDFCKALCPLVKIEKLPEASEAVKYFHLLDLMYHLIVPEPEEKQTQKVDRPKPSLLEIYNKTIERWAVEMPFCISLCAMIGLILLCAFAVVVEIILAIVLVTFAVSFGLIFGVLRILVRLLVYLVKLCNPLVEILHEILTSFSLPFLKPITEIVGQVKRAGKLCSQESTNLDTGRPPVTIPSVMELRQAGIQFHPAEGGIASIKFDEGIFYLPKIRVDVNSEVIIRNLVAYESLAKSNCLIFTRYVELMRAIIDTADDVKLLVYENIIQTQLSDEQVAQLFNGMSRSIRPTNTPCLDDVIKNVNAKFNGTIGQKLHRFMTKYVYPFGKFLAVLAALALLVLTAMQSYCSIYSCSGTSKFGKLPEDGYADRNNYFISSM